MVVTFHDSWLVPGLEVQHSGSVRHMLFLSGFGTVK